MNCRESPAEYITVYVMYLHCKGRCGDETRRVTKWYSWHKNNQNKSLQQGFFKNFINFLSNREQMKCISSISNSRLFIKYKFCERKCVCVHTFSGIVISQTTRVYPEIVSVPLGVTLRQNCQSHKRRISCLLCSNFLENNFLQHFFFNNISHN